MLFNSYMFWAFLTVVVVLYRMLPHKAQNRMLLIASYIFYGCWDWRYLSLILVSTLVDYFASLGLERSDKPKRRKALCALSVCVNLGLLGLFKYHGFFATELARLFQLWGVPVPLASLKLVLPVGISFYTFQTMGYTIDVYRRKTRAVESFLDFALYVAFFPQLVAGPIERSSRLLPQILNPRPRRPDDFAVGLHLSLLGLFKKIVIADNMARIVDAVFASDPGQLTGIECWVGVYAFALQIYGDFSGYSSIARGVARWLGFDIMVNFKTPYFAACPREFWQRWHISLSTWLRDYLYIPLGGNRQGKARTARNIFITMLLGGLWHGAMWTFAAWGFFHACLLLIARAVGWDSAKSETSNLSPKRLFGVVVTFHLVCIGWLLFRAPSAALAGNMFLRMVTSFEVTEFAAYGLGVMLFFAAPFLVFEGWLMKSRDMGKLLHVHWLWRAAAYSYVMLMLTWFPPEVTSEFIYFQF